MDRDHLDPDLPQWKPQIVKWRDELGVSNTYKPWESLGVKIKGHPYLTLRARAILNMVVAEKVKQAKLKKETPKTVRKTICKTIVDLSQNPCRKTFTNKAGMMRTMTSSSKLVYLGRESIVLPREMLWLQGHSVHCKLPEQVRMNQMRMLAGEGMSLPCLAVCLWSQFLVHGFPDP